MADFREIDVLSSAEYEQLTDHEQLLDLAAASEMASSSLASEQDQDDQTNDLFSHWGL